MDNQNPMANLDANTIEMLQKMAANAKQEETKKVKEQEFDNYLKTTVDPTIQTLRDQGILTEITNDLPNLRSLGVDGLSQALALSKVYIERKKLTEDSKAQNVKVAGAASTSASRVDVSNLKAEDIFIGNNLDIEKVEELAKTNKKIKQALELYKVTNHRRARFN
jgi:hypothetical protein